MIETQWSSTKTLELQRSANNVFGISLIVGKITITTPTGAKVSTVGVFIKSVALANVKGSVSYQVGDRVLKIGDVDLQDANKEVVIKALQNTNESILITVQSLLLLWLRSVSLRRCMQNMWYFPVLAHTLISISIYIIMNYPWFV